MDCLELQAWRKRLRIPQSKAADLLGVPLRTYQQWEQGRAPPHPLLTLACERVTQTELAALRKTLDAH